MILGVFFMCGPLVYYPAFSLGHTTAGSYAGSYALDNIS